MFIFRFFWFIFTGIFKILFLITAGIFVLSGITTLSEHIEKPPLSSVFDAVDTADAANHLRKVKVTQAFTDYKSYLKDYVAQKKQPFPLR